MATVTDEQVRRVQALFAGAHTAAYGAPEEYGYLVWRDETDKVIAGTKPVETLIGEMKEILRHTGHVKVTFVVAQALEIFGVALTEQDWT
jgi:hypothetical protein